MTVKERIKALRACMKERKIDAYMVPTDDYHASEYVGEYFKCREYITGFDGSAGTAVITQDMAGLWTDGRYFIQAEQQLAGSGVELFKSGEPGVPAIHEFLQRNIKKGGCLGFDGRCVSAAEAETLTEMIKEQGAYTACGDDLIGEIWKDRPQMSCEPAWELELCWAGKSREDKLIEIREKMKLAGAQYFLLTSLDDIAWLLNIRGNDIHTCPVVLSYLLMTQQEVFLYVHDTVFSGKLKEKLEKAGVLLRPYFDVYKDVAELKKDSCMLLDKNKVNYLLLRKIPAKVKVLNRQNLTLQPKAVKNPVEVKNERIAHIRDGVAVTRFIYWLKNQAGRERITELSAAKHLEALRREQEHFLGNSFDPIISYGPHAAMNHYCATVETDVQIRPKGLVLADTGGHYLEGSTDITRTIVMGELTEEQKLYFTAVLRGMLNLAAAKFLYGCTGLNLDYLAREPLWEVGKDFKHGTGHGVGYCLNVHEGPNSFRWRSYPSGGAGAVLEEGMITSDEPGYYVEGEYGIRHENLIVCKKTEENSFGQFMCFEHLTMAPFDLDGVKPELMTARERKLLNNYHKEVYTKLSPYLDEKERSWLKKATRNI